MTERKKSDRNTEIDGPVLFFTESKLQQEKWWTTRKMESREAN